MTKPAEPRPCETCKHWEARGISAHGVRYGTCCMSPGHGLTTASQATCNQHDGGWRTPVAKP